MPLSAGRPVLGELVELVGTRCCHRENGNHVIDDWEVAHRLGLWEGFGESLEPLMGGDR